MFDAVRRYFSPLEVFRDASRGTAAERAAAYRHNYEMRACLLGYIQRWLWTGTLALFLVMFFDSQSSHGPSLDIFVLLAAAPAVFASVAVCGIFLMAYAYVWLSYGGASPLSEPRDAARNLLTRPGKAGTGGRS